MAEQKNLVAFQEFAEGAGIALPVWSALVNSLYVGAKPESVVMAYEYCKARGLDVLKKPVHIVPMNVKVAKDKYQWRDVIFPGVNEMRTTASRTGLMAGQDEVVFGPTIALPITNNTEVKDPVMFSAPEWAKVTVYRLDKNGTPRAYTHIEYFAEAVARTGDGRINSMWQKRPHGQLGKCAEAGALRKAFPEEVGGEYSAEEMEGKTIGEAGAVTIVEAEIVTDKVPDDLVPAEKVAEAVKENLAAADINAHSVKADSAPAPAKAAESKKVEPSPAEKPEAPQTQLKIDLPAPAKRVLNGLLKNNGFDEASFLAAFGKDVSLININDAIKFAKESKK